MLMALCGIPVALVPAGRSIQHMISASKRMEFD